MTLNPMNRKDMNALRVHPDEKQITHIVTAVYNHAINSAKITQKTQYYYPVPTDDPFYRANIPVILCRLEALFPDCIVSHSLLARGTNGKLYDISKISDDNLHFVNTVNEDSYIIIDWT
jgi:hypothetical protein